MSSTFDQDQSRSKNSLVKNCKTGVFEIFPPVFQFSDAPYYVLRIAENKKLTH